MEYDIFACIQLASLYPYTAWFLIEDFNLKALPFTVTKMTKLDVGCGNLQSHTARGDINLDLDPNPANHPPNFVPGDVQNLPFENEQFENVTFFEVIEHVDNPKRALQEIHRVLKSGGVVEISTPNPTHWRKLLRHLLHMRCTVWVDHIYLWSREELENLLRFTGFKVEEVDYKVVWARQRFDKKLHRWIDVLVHKFSLCHALTGRCLYVKARKVNK